MSARIVAPLLTGLLMLALWEGLVRAMAIPPYILPDRSWWRRTLVSDWGTLSPALVVTLTITLQALLAAVVVGVLLALLFSLSRWIELSLFPYAIILQVTPIVAIAPLIIAWVDDVSVSLLICAWLVAFFPILSNTVLGCARSTATCSTCSNSTARAAGARCSTCACRRRCRTSWEASAFRVAWH